MGTYICDHCNERKHSDNDGHHYAKGPGGFVFDFCNDCHEFAVLDERYGFVEYDGKDLNNHFICPECLEVKPDTELTQYTLAFELDSPVSEPLPRRERMVCNACRDEACTRHNRDGANVLVFRGEDWDNGGHY